jgi:F-type H+-transporting ATPase subunit gamma
MTEQFAETRRRIDNVHQLEAVVTAMRAIAASRAQQARGLLPGLHAYTSVIARAIGQALALLPEGHNPAGSRAHRGAAILFCAEEGFAGAFSDRVLDVVATDAATRDLFLVGTRGIMLAGERRIPLAWHAAMVPHASLIPTLAARIADALYDWLSDSVGPRVDVLVPSWSAVGGMAVERRSLLPFDFRHFSVPAAGQQPPLITLPPQVLLARLAEEYVFAELCEGALTAFAAENEARVAAMLAAKTNLEHMRSDLEALQRQIRQEEITAEVVELASSAGLRR